MIFERYPEGARVDSTRPGQGNGTVHGSSKPIKSRNQTAKSRYQTGKLLIADWRTGKDWK